jgi:predicted AAA+ superfamily ATPase
MLRKQLNFMKKWLEKPTRKPLVIRGARQVGKSTLLQLFAEQQGIRLAAINLERQANLAPAFATNNPREILNVLATLPGQGGITPGDLLFLDEIQALPEALGALRYFYEELPELAVVSAGSLLEFALGDGRFSMPVGRVEYLHMGPMTFSEFLLALGEDALAHFIQTWEPMQPINPVVHQRFTALLRLYYSVGGMPEAVKTYATNQRLSEVSEVHASIIQTYRDDFPKYIGTRNQARIQQVFNYAARNVGQKVKYSQFSSDDKSATIKADIELLCLARVLHKVVHSHCNGLPLQGEVEEKTYKLLFLDIGLMNAICGLNWQELSMVKEARFVNEGPNAEQFIGQHLVELLAAQPNRELTYWLREARSNNAELDYVIALNGRILPIEVKAGATGSLRSLLQFMAEKRLPTAIRFDASPPTITPVSASVRRGQGMEMVRFTLVSLPLYLVEALPRVVEGI